MGQARGRRLSPNQAPALLYAGLVQFVAAVEAHKHWPSDALASMLVGAPLSIGPSTENATMALGCLRNAVEQGLLTRDDVAQARGLRIGGGAPLQTHRHQ